MKALKIVPVLIFCVVRTLFAQDTTEYADEAEKAFAKAYELSVTPDTVQLNIKINADKINIRTDKYAYEINQIAVKIWQEYKLAAQSTASDTFAMRIILDGVKTTSEYAFQPATKIGTDYAQSIALTIEYWQEREYEPHPEDELSFFRVEYAVMTEKLRRGFSMPSWSTSEEIWAKMERWVEFREKCAEWSFRITLWSDGDITFLEEKKSPFGDIDGVASTIHSLWDSLGYGLMEPTYQNGRIFILGKCTVKIFFMKIKS